MSYQVLTLVLARCLRNHSFSLREALVNKSPTLSLRHETIMIPKGSPKGFAYAAIHVVLHVLVKNSTYAHLTQHVCSTWSLRNLTHHNVFHTPQIDIT